MAMDEDNDDQLGGRGRTRREIREATRFARQLVEIPPERLAALDLPEPLARGIELARSLTAYGARKRQLDYVDQMLRSVDEDVLARIARAVAAPERVPDARSAFVRAWRRRLVAGDEALADLIDDRPAVDRQRLRQLVRNARKGPRGLAALEELLTELWSEG